MTYKKKFFAFIQMFGIKVVSLVEDKVEQFINEHQLIPHYETLVIGVSGGPDSMALLHFLKERKEKYGIRLICCSIDHGLRGEASRKDVEFVEKTAASWKIPFESIFVDVQELKKNIKAGTQVAARTLRFEAFEQVLERHHSRFLILAQHGDDQIETMLMQHVRGGLGGALAGMPVKRELAWGSILRPFLCVTKAEILDYCQRNHILFRLDPSNDADDYTRNRFRHHVLPFLKQENPKVHERFQRQSEWLIDDETLLNQSAKETLDSIKEIQTNKSFVLSQSGFLKEPVPLQRRMLHLILTYLYENNCSNKRHQSIHIDALINWLNQGFDSSEWSLPGPLVARKANGSLIIRTKDHLSTEYSVEPKKIPIPGHLSTPIGEFKIDLFNQGLKPNDDEKTFAADLDALDLPIKLRQYQPGDRIPFFGQNGTKKLSRLFIDSKVPKEWRSNWPVIEDGKGQIIWVPMLKRSHMAVMNEETTTFLIITFSPSKDFGRIM